MDYVILGAGPAGVIAAETLRKADPAGSVTVIGDEPEPPYSRMAIPYLLIEDIGEDGTYLRHGDGHYESLGIEVRRDRATAVSLATLCLRSSSIQRTRGTGTEQRSRTSFSRSNCVCRS